MPRIKPGLLGKEARMLPLCYAAPSLPESFERINQKGKAGTVATPTYLIFFQKLNLVVKLSSNLHLELALTTR